MAAIMALIFVPVLAAVGLMVMSNLGTTAAIMAALTFGLLAFGVFGGLFKMARGWEDEAV